MYTHRDINTCIRIFHVFFSSFDSCFFNFISFFISPFRNRCSTQHTVHTSYFVVNNKSQKHFISCIHILSGCISRQRNKVIHRIKKSCTWAWLSHRTIVFQTKTPSHKTLSHKTHNFTLIIVALFITVNTCNPHTHTSHIDSQTTHRPAWTGSRSDRAKT